MWRAAHLTAVDAPAISQSLSRSFTRVCDEHLVDLPEEVRGRLCCRCGALQLPTLTCSVRVKRRRARSRINRNGIPRLGKGAGEKFRNEVVRRCLLCGRVSQRAAGHRRGKGNKRPLRDTPSTTSQAPPVVSTPRFSFTSGGRQSAPGKLESEWIPLPSSENMDKPTPIQRLSLIELEKKNKKMRRRAPSHTASSVSNGAQQAPATESFSLVKLKSIFGQK